MPLPDPASEEDVCVLPDGSVRKSCALVDTSFMAPYPPSEVPSASKSGLMWSGDKTEADFTFHLTAGVRQSETEAYAPEYFLNKKSWQLFRSSMLPLLFEFSSASTEAGEPTFDDPIISGPLPIGSVVDLIIENQLNDTIPLYKHGAASWLLGSGAHEKFPHATVQEAMLAGKAGSGSDHRLNLDNPGRVIVHDLPPLGWSVIRFQVVAKEVTMLHAVKLRYFVVSSKQYSESLQAKVSWRALLIYI